MYGVIEFSKTGVKHKMKNITYPLKQTAPIAKNLELTDSDKIEILRNEHGLESLDTLILLRAMFEIHELMGSSVELTTDNGYGTDETFLASFPDSTAPEWTVLLWNINLTRYESESNPLYHASMEISWDLYDFARNEGVQGIQKVINATENSMSISEAISMHTGKMQSERRPTNSAMQNRLQFGIDTVSQFRRERGFDNIDDLLLLRTIFELQDRLGQSSADLFPLFDTFYFQSSDGLVTNIEVCEIELTSSNSDNAYGYHAKMEVTGDLYKFACKQGTGGIQKLIDLCISGVNVSDAIERVPMCLSANDLIEAKSILTQKTRSRL